MAIWPKFGKAPIKRVGIIGGDKMYKNDVYPQRNTRRSSQLSQLYQERIKSKENEY